CRARTKSGALSPGSRGRESERRRVAQLVGSAGRPQPAHIEERHASLHAALPASIGDASPYQPGSEVQMLTLPHHMFWVCPLLSFMLAPSFIISKACPPLRAGPGPRLPA